MQGPLTIGVLRSKRMPGAQDLSEIPQLEPAAQYGLVEAFTQAFPDDAHFLCYYATGVQPPSGLFTPAPHTRYPLEHEIEPYPRLRKAGLYRLRALGAEIMCWGVALDFDNEDHQPWNPHLRAAWNTTWSRAMAANPFFANYSFYYTTRSGARVVYVYDEPVRADEHEGKVRWFVKQFKAMGITNIDESVWDWTRLFRLPYVMRDGYPSWAADPNCPLEVEVHQQNCIAAKHIPQVAREKRECTVAVKPFNEPRPGDEIAKALIAHFDGKNFKQTDWLKQAKKRLRGRECYDVLFSDRTLASLGERTNSLVRMVGSAISMLFTLAGTTPQHIYALFLDPISLLVPDQGTPCWKAELWTVVGSLWSQEEASHIEGELEEAARAAEVFDLAKEMTENMRVWMDRENPGVMPTEEGPALRYMLEHSLCVVDSSILVLDPKGGYFPIQLTDRQLFPFLREKGLDDIIEIRKPSGEFLAVSDVLNKHATVVHALRQEPQAKDGFVKRIGSSDSTMHFCPFRRNEDLEPEPSKEVDDWLKAFFGRESYVEGLEWIAWALAFDEGAICALSLKGAEGAGKDMLVQGLAETLRLPAVANASDLTSDWQYGMLSSPWIHINEGWPRGYRGKHPSETFRELVGGGERAANQKRRAPVTISNPMRVIMTANNMHVVRMLVEGKEMTKDDQRAIGRRIKHFNIGGAASRFLRERGGMQFTGREGARWVKGQSGERSNHVLAKHFLWLWEQRGDRERQGNRFLVEGNFERSVMLELRTGSGITPFVIEAVVRIVSSKAHQPADQGVKVQFGRLYITLRAVQEYMRDELSGNLRTAQPAQIKEVLLSLSPEEETVSPFGNRRRYYQIDTLMLADQAREAGIVSEALNAINEDRANQEGVADMIKRRFMGLPE